MLSGTFLSAFYLVPWRFPAAETSPDTSRGFPVLQPSSGSPSPRSSHAREAPEDDETSGWRRPTVWQPRRQECTRDAQSVRRRGSGSLLLALATSSEIPAAIDLINFIQTLPQRRVNSTCKRENAGVITGRTKNLFAERSGSLRPVLIVHFLTELASSTFQIFSPVERV